MAAKKQYVDTPRAFVQCAPMACQTGAIVYVKTRTGWADFCEKHARDYHQAEAEEYLVSVGLEKRPDETREQHIERMRTWIKKKVKAGLFKRIPVSREPGEDLEEAA